MTRKIAFVLSVLILCLNVVAARPNTAGEVSALSAMAKYFPATTSLFAAMRVDALVFDEFELIWANIRDNLPAEADLPQVTIYEAIDTELNQAGISLDALYAWLGDYAAVGLYSIDTDSPELSGLGYFVVEVRDQAALMAFIETQAAQNDLSLTWETTTGGSMGTLASATSEGDVIFYIDADVMYISAPEAMPRHPGLTREARLDQYGDYQTVTAKLPADAYHLMMYFDLTEVLRGQNFDELEALGVMSNALSSFALGFTLQDKYTLVMDSVQLPNAYTLEYPNARIDPAFMGHIPANATLFYHGADLSGTLSRSIDELNRIAAQSGDTQNYERQIAAIFDLIGLELEADVLSWMTGDYALFMRLDNQGVFGGISGALFGASNNDLYVTDLFDFGLMIEATDPVKAQNVIDKFVTLVEAGIASAEGVSIADTVIGGTTVTRIEIQDNGTPIIDLVFGANDAVLFIGTTAAAESVFTGADGVDTTATFAELSPFILPDTVSVSYADSDGVVSVVATVAAALVFVATDFDSVFEQVSANIEGSFDEKSAPQMPQAEALHVQRLGDALGGNPAEDSSDTDTDADTSEADTVEDAIIYLKRLFGGAVSSFAQTDDGTLISRWVFRFNPL